VPVRLRLLDQPEANFAAVGGSRVEGTDQGSGRRAACTTGFVVTDQARTGIVTAAHCPYTLVYRDPAGTTQPLSQVGAWGARYQDVQIQTAEVPLAPLFFSDRAKSELRTVTRWRNRASTRAGDVVCHRGEKTGYSCAEVELVDYAPPGDLCGGPCDVTWVTVAGPSCGAGDSGGSVFAGTVAFGILKGGSYRRDGGCTFYYYMSTDYLPPGWTLLYR
jgi:streptogrisin C